MKITARVESYGIVSEVEGSVYRISIKSEGQQGIQGAAGQDGVDGQGVPAGGSTGQVLAKIDGTDYNTEWVNQSGGGGGAVDSVNGQTGTVVLDTGDISEETDKNYVTDAEKTKLSNTSGINTGDQDLSPYELLSNKVTTLSSPNNDDYPTTQLLSDSLNAITPVSPVYMLTGINSDISGYESAVALSSYTAGALATVSETVTTSETLLEEFATNLGFPNTTALPIGIYSAHWETQKAAGSNNYHSYFKLFKRSSGGTETLLLTSDNSSQSALNTVVQVSVTAFNSSVIPLLATDRLVLKVYAQMASSSASITLRFDDNTDARLQLAGSPLSYIPEDVANKVTDLNSPNDTDYPTSLLLSDELSEKLGDTFESVSKNLKQYDYALNYTLGDLTSIVYTVPSVGAITKTFNYTLGVLDSIVLSGNTPSGIELTKTFNYTLGVLTSVTYS